MTREFCTQCGTPLFVSSTRFANIQMLMLSTLINAVNVQPRFEIWCKSKVSWAKVSDEVSCFPGGALD